jgi:ubiquinone biosynthesis protein UbiJ
MPLFPVLPTPARLAAGALNALLRREDWARERLARHAGKTVRFAAGRLVVGFVIDTRGYTEVADAAVVPDVTLTLSPEKFKWAGRSSVADRSAVARSVADGSAVASLAVATPAVGTSAAAAAQERRDRIAEVTHIAGDAGLAQVVAELAANLRWDVEDDLARVTGDVAAARLTGAARSMRAAAIDVAQRLAANVAEYVSEEQPLVTGRPVWSAWRTQTAALDAHVHSVEADAGRIEARLRRLEARARVARNRPAQSGSENASGNVAGSPSGNTRQP